MANQGKNLPSFKNPPVVEVVAGVQFSFPANIRTFDFSDIWCGFGKENFPTYSEMPPLDPLPNPMQDGNIVRFEFSPLPPMPRLWFETPNRDGLIQLQKDRFIYNWRKRPDNACGEYPRYENVVANFFRNYDIFKNVLISKEIDLPKAQVLELIYVNMLESPDGGYENLSAAIKGSFSIGSGHFLPAISSVGTEWQFRIDEINSILRINITPVQSARDGSVKIKCEIAVTGPAQIASVESENQSLRIWFDTARMWIVNAFADITTDKMHEVWGRTA